MDTVTEHQISDLISNVLPNVPGVKIDKGRYYIFRRESKKIRRIPLTRVDEGTEACEHFYAEKFLNDPAQIKTIEQLLWFFINGTKQLLNKSIRRGETDEERRRRGILSPATVEDYEKRVLCRAERTDLEGRKLLIGLVPFFGRMLIPALQDTHVAQYLEQGVELDRAVSANRDKAVLQSAWAYGRRKGVAGCRGNPFDGVERNPEFGSDVYVTDDQLSGLCNASLKRGNDGFAILMRACHVSGIRITDLIGMTRDMMTDEGVPFTESKTGKKSIMKWKPGMCKIWDDAVAYGNQLAAKITKKLPKPRDPPAHIFVNTKMRPFTISGINSNKRHYGADFAVRQLRAKAQTDGEKKGINVTGHTGQMRNRYNRVKILEALD